MRRPAAPFGLSAGLYFLLTIALTWPLILHPGSRVPNDLGDSLLNMFLLAWNARETPFSDRWWNVPQFYPIPGAMAFSEHLLGLSLIATPAFLASGNILFAYNAAFFLSFPLCALAAHALAYHLTKRHDLALLCGLAYAFAPYRMSQFSHVQVLSSYWMPLALLGLHRFVERRTWGSLALFAVAWYLQALACGYYLFYLSVLVGLWLLWFAAGKISWRDAARLAFAWALAVAALVPVALGYLRYQRMYGFRRWPDEIQSFSADVASVLAAARNLRLWGWLNVVERPESALFPGLALILVIVVGVVVAWRSAAHEQIRRLRAPRLLLAAAMVFALAAATPAWIGPWKIELFGVRLLSVGTPQKPLSIAVLLAAVALALHPSIRAGWRRRSALAFYTIAAVAMWLFSLGPAPTLMNRPLLYKAPYAWLLMVPGVDGVRVPARFWTLATLCLAVAGAIAAGHLAGRWPGKRAVILSLAGLLLMIESWPAPLLLLPPPDFRPARARASARLELPQNSGLDLVALYRATEHRRPLINGYSGYFAPHYSALNDLLRHRSGAALAHLTTLGPMEVVVDHEQDGQDHWRRFISSQPQAELVHHEARYSLYLLPRSATPLRMSTLGGLVLPIQGLDASTGKDRLGNLADGDLVSRWDSAGPQDPGNWLTIDLGARRHVTGVELLLGGYVADYPRSLIVDTSDDAAQWTPAYDGETALLTLVAALEEPRTVPVRVPLDNRETRYIRLRQVGSERIYYWSIAELRVYGS